MIGAVWKDDVSCALEKQVARFGVGGAELLGKIPNGVRGGIPGELPNGVREICVQAEFGLSSRYGGSLVMERSRTGFVGESRGNPERGS